MSASSTIGGFFKLSFRSFFIGCTLAILLPSAYSAEPAITSVGPDPVLGTATGQNFCPAITRPDFYFGFVGLGLAWQVAFLVIASDPGSSGRSIRYNSGSKEAR
jgi:hypothetical protein